ncbi:hypothetical protein [Azohydromonas aeria]|uniref:hypothetical protein n=1 Tax=Azohydromonas aeria TaxID=2590212 RepID=UPI0012F8F591|nr:hypothetical protein [Azohydromonas aeria]
MRGGGTQAPESAATLELWHRLGMQLRLALYADDPRLVARYLSCGEALVARHGHSPWQVHDRMLSLLLTTAYDTLLPIVWRMTCLDACSRPMSALGALVCDDASAARLRILARRLASFSCNPADPERAA